MNSNLKQLSLICLVGSTSILLGQGSGGDPLDNLGAAKELMTIIDSGLFHWIGRLMAGICILSAGWALKEQKFSVAVVCLLGAMLFGTAVKWVKNVFSMGGDKKGVFDSGMIEVPQTEAYKLASKLVKGLKSA